MEDILLYFVMLCACAASAAVERINGGEIGVEYSQKKSQKKVTQKRSLSIAMYTNPVLPSSSSSTSQRSQVISIYRRAASGAGDTDPPPPLVHSHFKKDTNSIH